jgi:hypothetical protein
MRRKRERGITSSRLYLNGELTELKTGKSYNRIGEGILIGCFLSLICTIQIHADIFVSKEVVY